MTTPAAGDPPDRISISRPKKAPARPFTAIEMTTLRHVADALIPAEGGFISGGSVSDFEGLATRAAGILDKNFSDLAETLNGLSSVPQPDLWASLERLSKQGDGRFYVLSTLVAGIYLYSNEIKSELNYPAPHSNPPSMFEIADELSSGILDPVINGGFKYRIAD